MQQKETIDWRKLVLLDAIFALALTFFIALLPSVSRAYASFRADVKYSLGFVGESSSLFYPYLAIECICLSVMALTLYALFRSFRPARLSAGDGERSLRRWRTVTCFCLTALVVILMMLVLHSRSSGGVGNDIANGGSFISISELRMVGRLFLGGILSLDGIVFSLIRRGELKSGNKA